MIFLAMLLSKSGSIKWLNKYPTAVFSCWDYGTADFSRLYSGSTDT